MEAQRRLLDALMGKNKDEQKVVAVVPPVLLPIKLRVNNELHRIRFDEVSLEKVHNHIARLNDNSRTPYVLKYKDDEGDDVTITSTAELEEAMRVAVADKRKTLLITVEEVVTPAEQEKSQSAKQQPQQQQQAKQEQVEEKKEREDEVAVCATLEDGADQAQFSVRPQIRLVDLMKMIVTELRLQSQFIIKFIDDEDDAVTIADDATLQEALAHSLKDSRLLVLLIKPIPRALRLDGDQQEQQHAPEEEHVWEKLTPEDLKYGMTKLQQAGFHDDELNEQLLRQFRGKVKKALDELQRRKLAGEL